MVLLDLLAMLPVFSVFSVFPLSCFLCLGLQSLLIFRTIVESVFPFQNVKKLRFKGKKCCFKNHVLFTICHGGVFFPAHNFNTFLSVCLKQEDKTFAQPHQCQSVTKVNSFSILFLSGDIYPFCGKKSIFLPNID